MLATVMLWGRLHFHPAFVPGTDPQITPGKKRLR
jgi:hypothetical protein